MILIGVFAMATISSCSSSDDNTLVAGVTPQKNTMEVLDKEFEKKYLIGGNSDAKEKLGLFWDSSISYEYNDKGLLVSGKSLVDYKLSDGVEKQDISVKVVYDSQNRVVRTTTKDVYGVSDERDNVFTYDDNGRLLKIVNELNTKEYSHFFYNDKNQVVKIEKTYESGSLEVYKGFVYNSSGELTSIEDEYSTESFEYDGNPIPYGDRVFSAVLEGFTDKISDLESVYKAVSNVKEFKITYKDDDRTPIVQKVEYEYDKLTKKPLKSTTTVYDGRRLEKTVKEFTYKTIKIKK